VIETVYFVLRDYLDGEVTEDEADPVYNAIQDTVCRVEGADLVTEPMATDDWRALVFRASPAVELAAGARAVVRASAGVSR